MKAERAVKRITFHRSEASQPRRNSLCFDPAELNEDEVLVPGSLALLFDLDLAEGDVNNVLVQNVSLALVDKEWDMLSRAFKARTF